MKCESFSKIWSTEDSSGIDRQGKPGIREQRKSMKISTALQDNLFKPVILNGVEYKTNAQALLYRYFTTMNS